MKQLHVAPRQKLLTYALLLAPARPACVQVADETCGNPAPGTSASETDIKTRDTVVVTGIRGSLTSSMNLRREHLASRHDRPCWRDIGDIRTHVDNTVRQWPALMDYLRSHCPAPVPAR